MSDLRYVQRILHPYVQTFADHDGRGVEAVAEGDALSLLCHLNGRTHFTRTLRFVECVITHFSGTDTPLGRDAVALYDVLTASLGEHE
jgi:hypothetical protein